MRQWTVRAAATCLAVLSALLAIAGRTGGFLSCGGWAYSEVNGNALVVWMNPTACSIDGLVPLPVVGLLGLVVAGAWLLRGVLRPR